MEKRYPFQTTEEKIYRQWEKSGLFNPDHLLDSNKQSYTIVLPPPNITGALHIGHALNVSIQDVLMRKKEWRDTKLFGYPVSITPALLLKM
jgi:valyl-tRNA synthetase